MEHIYKSLDETTTKTSGGGDYSRRVAMYKQEMFRSTETMKYSQKKKTDIFSTIYYLSSEDILSR